MHFEFLLQEPSMEAFLELWLSRFLPEGCSFSTHPFRGKPDLLRKLGDRLQAYSKWLPPECRVVVIVDRDNEDCAELKERLRAICMSSGLRLKNNNRSGFWQVMIRIAIEELEAWYFGDWEAVRTAYPRVPANIPQRAAYRNPDAIKGGTSERFERLLQGSGYHAGGLQKLDAARQIGMTIDVGRSKSASFRCLAAALSEAVS